MKVLLVVSMIALLALPLEAQSKEADRVQNAGTVMKEILSVPDDIPQQLLDHKPTDAECLAYLVGAAARALGVATYADFADYLRISGERRAPATLDAAATAAGLVAVAMPNGGGRQARGWAGV